MTTNINENIIIKEIVNKEIIFFSHFAFLLSSEVSVAFTISSSLANTNLAIRRLWREQFLIPKYSSIIHALLHSQSHEL